MKNKVAAEEAKVPSNLCWPYLVIASCGPKVLPVCEYLSCFGLKRTT